MTNDGFNSYTNDAEGNVLTVSGGGGAGLTCPYRRLTDTDSGHRLLLLIEL
jgi:hypothetical protein